MPTGESVDWICQPQELHDQGKSLQTLPSVHLGEAGNLPSKYIGISTIEYCEMLVMFCFLCVCTKLLPLCLSL